MTSVYCAFSSETTFSFSPCVNGFAASLEKAYFLSDELNSTPSQLSSYRKIVANKHFDISVIRGDVRISIAAQLKLGIILLDVISIHNADLE